MNTRPLLYITATVVAVQVALAAWTLMEVPAGARVPTHWGIDGTPDGFADAWLAVGMTPALTLGLGLLLSVIPRFDPRRANLARSATAYLWICGSLLVMMAGLQLFIALAARDNTLSIVPFVGVGVGLLLVVIGNFLGKTRSSWFMGIRTPWTLSSELSWARTHRIGGYLFMLVGAVAAVSALVLPPQVFFWVLMGGIFGTTAALVAYSYVVWRNDPDRQTSDVGQA